MNQHPSPAGDHAHSDNPPPNPNPSESHSSDYAPYPTLDPNDVAPPPDPLLAQRSDPSPSAVATTMPQEHNPYVSAAPRPTSSTKNAMETVKDLLGKWGKQANEAAIKAQDLAGNMWQHLKTSPNMAEAAVTRISHQTKIIAEGGYEKVFCQTFESLPDEQLRKWYACYLSTSAGPVMGTLYLSTAKLAFCSDSPLSYKNGEQTTWSYYKVVILLDQLKAVNPSTSKANPLEKYIQIITIDNHEFWFMGFVNYDSAVKNLQEIHTSN